MTVLRRETLQSLEAMENLAPQWWQLYRRCEGATPFQSPAMLIAYWRAFAPGTLASMAIFAGRDLVGFAPFYRETGQAGERLLLLGMGPCDLLDVLVDPDWEGAARRAFCEFIASLNCACDLEHASENAHCLLIPLPDGWSQDQGTQEVCPVLDLSEGSGIPARQRRKIRMAEHRAERRGGFRVLQAKGSAIAPALERLFQLHAKRWQDLGEDGVFASRAMRQFVTDAATGLATEGELLLFSALIDQEIAGVFLGFSHDGVHYAFANGFDPVFAYESPGTLLLAHAIAHATLAGAKEFNWLRGSESYKFAWGAKPRQTFRRSLTPNNGSSA